MSDPRNFIKVHNGLPEHPKVVDLSDRAFRNLIELWCYSSRNLTDGLVKKRQADKILTTKTRQELLNARLMELHPDGVQMHDYLLHQMSKDEVADLHVSRSEAGRKGGLAKANSLASATAGASPGSRSKHLADKDVDKDVDKKEHTRKRVALDTDPHFTEFWSVYPRRIGKGAAKTAWPTALKKAEPVDIILGAKSFAVCCQGQDQNFIPYPATWLNAERWADEQAKPTTAPNAWMRRRP